MEKENHMNVTKRAKTQETEVDRFFGKEAWVRRIWCRANDDEAEIMCDICQSDMKDEETGDDLVICDKCQVAVHMSCYGHDLLDGMPSAA
jgi:hypothetical protein